MLVPGFQTINTKLRLTQSQQRLLKLEMIMLCVQHFCKAEVETIFRHKVQLSRWVQTSQFWEHSFWVEFDVAMGLRKAMIRVTMTQTSYYFMSKSATDLPHESISRDGFLAILGGGRWNSTGLIQLLSYRYGGQNLDLSRRKPGGQKSKDVLPITAAWARSPSPVNSRAASFITGASRWLAASSNGLPARVSRL